MNPTSFPKANQPNTLMLGSINDTPKKPISIPIPTIKIQEAIKIQRDVVSKKYPVLRIEIPLYTSRRVNIKAMTFATLIWIDRKNKYYKFFKYSSPAVNKAPASPKSEKKAPIDNNPLENPYSLLEYQKLLADERMGQKEDDLQ